MAGYQVCIIMVASLLGISQVFAFSLSSNIFTSTLNNLCFNHSTQTGTSLVLGQNVPIGMSLENTISLIERLEWLNPQLKPADILRVLLKRYHMDGILFDGTKNAQSNVEFKHAMITNAILDDANQNNDPQLRDNFTPDEQCNIFFSISHVVNRTALIDENEQHTFWHQEIAKISKAPSRNMGKEVPVTSATIKSTTPQAIQSEFLDDKDNDGNLRQKRNVDYKKSVKLTKKPREYGVVSFLGSETNPIAMGRVLLGLYVGFIQPQNHKMNTILRSIGKKSVTDGIQDDEVKSLLAVTLSDLFAIDQNGMTYPENIFGADGKWNSTICHTQFTLTPTGIWGTLAEFRGGIDGYNIGNELPELLKQYPTLRASQALRYYYTKNGISLTGVCKRTGLQKNLQDDLEKEAIKYSAIWNSVMYDNQYPKENVEGYIDSVKNDFFETLNKAGTLRNTEEQALCNDQYMTDIKTMKVESTADAIFLLDNTQRCQPVVDCIQAKYVSKLVKYLNLGRTLGSTTVLFNARGEQNPALIDEQSSWPVATALHSTLYNSTSNECASCKSSNYIFGVREVIKEQHDLLQQLNTVIESYKARRANNSAVPGKLLYWFDFGTIDPVPTDRLKKVKYDQARRTLLFIHRDVTLFGLSTNTNNLKDIVLDSKNLVSLNGNEINTVTVDELVRISSEVPSVFQYPDCKTKSSNNYTYQGFITPGYKQYWAMYPDQFRSSGQIKMTFTSDLAFHVCLSRTVKPETKEENCKKAPEKSVIEFNVYGPCKNLIFEKCPAIYFTVAVDKAESPLCQDERCRNVKQVKWTFSHTGTFCSGSNAISISIVLVALSALFSSYRTL